MSKPATSTGTRPTRPRRARTHWKDSSTGWDGKHRWTGCGCTQGNNGECERTDRHRPEGHPPSADEWCEPESGELSDDEFGDLEWTEKRKHELLLDNYIGSCTYLIKKKLGKAERN